LQAVVELAAEKNSTLVLPFPVELLRLLQRLTPQATGTDDEESRAITAKIADGMGLLPSTNPQPGSGHSRRGVLARRADWGGR
jgi:hypothetical protein